MTPAIEISGLRKVYRVYRGHGRGWLASVLLPWLPVTRFATESVALDGVDLVVEPGEALAVLGRNGSGKSSLLRVLAGMSPATGGDVTVRGELRCIMATGIGFNARLTGRENIVYGSIAMGIPRRTAVARMDEIIEFAELGGEIDKPTMYYSRGMRARLALAVALQETPEVLILDEALSAGDAGFTERCRRRIDEICASGSTVLLATHSLALAQRACTRAIVLHDGRIVADADPKTAIGAYRALLGQPAPEEPKPAPPPRARLETDDAAELVSAYLCGDDGLPRDSFTHGERLELHAVLRTRRPIEKPRFRVELMSADTGVRLTQLGTHYLDAATKQLAALRPAELDGDYELTVTLPANPLGSGEFFWRIALYPWAQEGTDTVTCHFRASPVCPFSSVAFPERPWRRRRTLIEAASEVALSPVGEAQGRSEAYTAAKRSPSRSHE
jgi:ABC-type polysaccharide/polyol phosphate transport system ATPase subunit